MGRFLFNSQNKVGETYKIPTNKNGTFYWYIDKHDPNQFPLPYGGGGTATPTRNHRFNPGDGSQPIAPLLNNNVNPINTSNAQSHTYSDGSDKIFTIETDRLDQVRNFFIGFDSVSENSVFTGKTNLDLTLFKKLYSISIQKNSNITGATFNLDGTQPLYSFYANNCDLTGSLDLSSFNLNDFSVFGVEFNSNLNEIIFPPSGNIRSSFRANNCDLTGHYDFTGWSGVGSFFQWHQNSSLTGLTFPTINTTNGCCTLGLWIYRCDLTGTLDLSPLSECGRNFRIWANPNLTNVIFPSNTRNTTLFEFNNNDLRDLDISGLSGLTVTSTSSSNFRVDNNDKLSGVTTTDGLNKFNSTDFSSNFWIAGTNLPSFNVSGCTFANITVDFNGCPELKTIEFPSHPNTFDIRTIDGDDCPLLTDVDISAFNVTYPALTSNTFPRLNLVRCSSLSGLTTPITGKTGEFHFGALSCNLSGTLDLSYYHGLMKFGVGQNPNLTNLILPNTTSTQTLTDAGLFEEPSQKTFEADGCDLGYVDFKPMSGVTLNSSSTILLGDNNMTAGEVNHILDDFTTTTWNDVNLDIAGTNAAPDSSSGGFDGIAAINILTGVTRNWSITTS
ncbi:MAG: hypothetical protein ACW98X_26940 [Promethearchaeota archaeon]|jgi:hypothetical protein